MKIRNPIDAIVGFFSPAAGYARVMARLHLKRAYEAASPGDSWNPKRRGASANQDLRIDGATLRAKSRSLRQNVPFISAGMDARSAYGVGTGILSEFSDARVQEIWAEHQKVIDADGNTGWAAFQRKCWDAWDTDGEVFIRIRERRPTDGFTVPFQLQAMEPEWLDTTRTVADGGNQIVDGIEYDSIGRRVAYHFWTSHPNDWATTTTARRESKRVPAELVIHLFTAKRPGQHRGEPRLHAVINKTRDLAIYQDAELARKNLVTRLSVLSTGSPSQYAAPDAGSTGSMQDLGTLTSGGITQVPGGGNLTVIEPKDMPGYVETCKFDIHQIARGAGFTYEMATGDMSQANFTQGRMGMLQFRREIEQMQWTEFIPVLVDRVCREFLVRGNAVGAWGRPVQATVEHTAPRWEYIQPDQEVRADIAEIGQGLSTISDKLRARGEDPKRVFAQWKADMTALKEAGAWDYMLFLTKGNLPTEQGNQGTSSSGSNNGSDTAQ